MHTTKHQDIKYQKMCHKNSKDLANTFLYNAAYNNGNIKGTMLSFD